MIWGISCLQFCKKSADHKEGNTCSDVPLCFLIVKTIIDFPGPEGDSLSGRIFRGTNMIKLFVDSDSFINLDVI